MSTRTALSRASRPGSSPALLRFSVPTDSQLGALPSDPKPLLQHLARSGRALRQGRSHWLSYLPEIAERRLWAIPRTTGGAKKYRSLSHYARAVAGIDQARVDRTLALWRRVGRPYPVLWRELRRGASLTALDRIASSIRDDADARQFAQRIRQGWSVRDLETYCRDRRAAEGDGASATTEATTTEATTSAAAATCASPPDPRPCATTRGAPPAASRRPLPGTTARAPKPAAAAPSPTAPTNPPPPQPRRLELVLSEHDETLLHDLMRTAGEGAGLTVGEYLGRLLRGRAAQRVAQAGATRRRSTQRRDTRRRTTRGRPLAPADSAREQTSNPHPERDRGLSCAPAPCPASLPSLPTLPQLGTALRYVLVVHEDLATGTRTLRTRHGTRTAPAGLLAQGQQLGAPVDLAALRDQALISAATSKGEAIPPLVLRYVQLRSQGRCEAPGCHARADSTHHDERRAWKLDHHPDRLEARCAAHHTQDHLLGAERNDTPHAEPDAAFRRIRVRAVGG